MYIYVCKIVVVAKSLLCKQWKCCGWAWPTQKSALSIRGSSIKSSLSLKPMPGRAFSTCDPYSVMRGYNNMKCIWVSGNTGTCCQTGDQTHVRLEEHDCDSLRNAWCQAQNKKSFITNNNNDKKKKKSVTECWLYTLALVANEMTSSKIWWSSGPSWPFLLLRNSEALVWI